VGRTWLSRIPNCISCVVLTSNVFAYIAVDLIRSNLMQRLAVDFETQMDPLLNARRHEADEILRL